MEAEAKLYLRFAGRLYSTARFALIARLAGRRLRRLAERILKLVEKRITGVIHIAGERLSRYEFAVMLAEELGADRMLVKPIEMKDAKLVARRPRDSSLDTSKASEEGLAMPPHEGLHKGLHSGLQSSNKRRALKTDKLEH